MENKARLTQDAAKETSETNAKNSKLKCFVYGDSAYFCLLSSSKCNISFDKCETDG